MKCGRTLLSIQECFIKVILRDSKNFSYSLCILSTNLNILFSLTIFLGLFINDIRCVHACVNIDSLDIRSSFGYGCRTCHFYIQRRRWRFLLHILFDDLNLIVDLHFIDNFVNLLIKVVDFDVTSVFLTLQVCFVWLISW